MATITFDNIQSGESTSPTYTYTEAGFSFGPSSASGDGGRVFGVTNNGGGVYSYTGNALTADNGSASFASGEIKASDGSRFTPTSVQLNQLYNGSPGGAIRFFGSRNGTTVTFQDFGFDNDGGSLQTVTFGSAFQNIDSLSFSMNTAARQVQLDNFIAAPVCYMTGTRIRTTHGEVAVEALLVGDLAVTASGEHRPIRWIGQRTMDPRRHRVPAEAQPVRIRAHALGDNRPARDLRVSPGHSIAVDVLGEVLIPASALINGVTIIQEEVESVTYWHVELDSHDLLVAENLASESYLDMGNRGFFAGSAVVALKAGPDAEPSRRSHADFCRPYHADGLLVDAVRAQVCRRTEALGWRVAPVAPFADTYLEVDGRRVQPEVAGLSAAFALPAGAHDVWLVCPTSVPRAVGLGSDPRALGLCLSGLALDTGLGATRTVALDDPGLCLGFHAPEPDHRWTTGRARLPSALFAVLDGETVLRLDLAMPSLPRWVAPQAEASTRTPDAVAA